MNWKTIFAIVIAMPLATAVGIMNPLLQFVVSRGYQSSRNYDAPFTIIDEYGSLPSLKDAFNLVGLSTPIVIITGKNYTLFSYKEYPEVSHYPIHSSSRILINGLQIALSSSIGKVAKGHSHQ